MHVSLWLFFFETLVSFFSSQKTFDVIDSLIASMSLPVSLSPVLPFPELGVVPWFGGMVCFGVGDCKGEDDDEHKESRFRFLV